MTSGIVFSGNFFSDPACWVSLPLSPPVEFRAKKRVYLSSGHVY
jgi:hypothetical protein